MRHEIPDLPPDHWLFGELYSFRQQPLATVERAREFDEIVRWRIGPYSFVQVNRPDLVREVLVSKAATFHKTPRNKQVFRELMGEGLLVSDGEYWRRQRRLVQPAFHRSRIDSYGEIMVDYAQRMLADWTDAEPVDLNREMLELTLGIVCKTLFDAELEDEVYERVDRSLGIVLQRADDRFGRVLNFPSWLPTPTNLKAKRAIRDLNQVVMGIFETRRQQGVDTGDLMSMLLFPPSDDEAMSDQQVRDETMTLFLAGHETTANALTWTWTLLARHPQVEARLQQEVDRVLGDRPPTVEDLDSLPYTDWVVREALRLYPPAWIIGRQAVEPIDLGGYKLPEGTIVFISQWSLHRDRRFFGKPAEFRPERFSAENAESIPRYAYIPFGDGPRICIGNNFALMEARLVLATMVQAITLELAPDQDLTPESLVTLRPKAKIRARVRRRHALTERA